MGKRRTTAAAGVRLAGRAPNGRKTCVEEFEGVACWDRWLHFALGPDSFNFKFIVGARL